MTNTNRYNDEEAIFTLGLKERKNIKDWTYKTPDSPDSDVSDSYNNNFSMKLGGLALIAGLAFSSVYLGYNRFDKKAEEYKKKQEINRYEQFDDNLIETYNEWEQEAEENK